MSKAINYHLVEQWQTEYKTSLCQASQWGMSLKQSINQIKNYLPDDKQVNILEIGCGASKLSEELSNLGYNNITCIDFSKELIKTKRNKNSKITYILSDFSKPFTFAKDTQYDLIIDKCSIDCLFCQQNFAKKVLTCINQCYKVLKNEGHLISFSLAREKNRKVFYRNKLTPFQIQIKNLKLNSTSTSRKTINSTDQSQLILIICKKNNQLQKSNINEKGNYQREDDEQQENRNENSQHQQQEQKNSDKNENGQQKQQQDGQQQNQDEKQQKNKSKNEDEDEQQQGRDDQNQEQQQKQKSEEDQQNNEQENNQYDQNFES